MQPQSSGQVNDLEEAVGFHFMRQPDVEASIEMYDGEPSIILKKFMSDYSVDETGKEIANFESLSMVLIDNNYDGNFIMKDYYFSKDLIKDSKKKSVTLKEVDDDIREELKKVKVIHIPVKKPGKKIAVIYIDIYGNEFKEEFAMEDK